MKNKKTEEVIFKHALQCPNCFRLIPNKEHRLREGCKWCIHETK